MATYEIGLEDVRAAAERLRGVIVRTPLLPAEHLSSLAGGNVYLKAENLQRMGSFKLRGAYNRLVALNPAERARGVVAASAGNHAQGVALAARLLGIAATIVMPEGAALPKVTATRALGATVVLHGPTFDAAMDHARELGRERELVFIHAFDDPRIIAGQGTVGLEVVEDLPDVDLVVVPVGGGGLISGTAIAVRALRPAARVVGVQAAGAAALSTSLAAGRLVGLSSVRTIADGLAIKHPEESTYDLIRRHVDDMVTVDEDEIAWAMLMLLEQAHLVAEGAGAVGLAALLAGKLGADPGRVALVVSGGNVDVTLLDDVVERGLGREGRYVHLTTRVNDQPGALAGLLQLVGEAQGNVRTVEHDRLMAGVPLGETGVELRLETRDHEHIAALLARLEKAGYPVRIVPGT